MENIKNVEYNHTHRQAQFDNENDEWEVLENADLYQYDKVYVLKKPANEREANKLYVWHCSGELNRDGDVNVVNIFRLANSDDYVMVYPDNEDPFKAIGL